MKILQVVPYFYPAWSYGGPAKLVYDTSQYFSQQGHQVIVYTSDAYDVDQRMPDDLKVTKGIEVHYFANFNNLLAYRSNLFMTPGILWQSLFQITSFDVIHLHDFYTFQNVWLYWLSRVFQKKLIISVHGCLESARRQHRSQFKQLFMKLVGTAMLRHAHRVIATSQEEVKQYLEQGVSRSKIVLLGHGIDRNEVTTRISQPTARKKLQLPLKPVIITFLGRIHQIKGLDLLILAIKKVTGGHFVIAGSDDGYLSTLKKMITKHRVSSRLTLLSATYGEKKRWLFKASDVFVYPSYSEGFSLGVLEAAAAGLPLVLTEGCHFPEAEKQGAALIVPNQSQRLAEALTKVVNRPSLRKKMSQQAQLLIQEHYSMPAIGKQLLKVYQS